MDGIVSLEPRPTAASIARTPAGTLSHFHTVTRPLARALLAATLAIGAAPGIGVANVSSGTFENAPSIGSAPEGRITIPDARAQAKLEAEKSTQVRRNGRYGLTVLDTVPPKNFEMQLRVMALPSSQGTGGVAFRMTGRGSYYALEIDAGRNRIAFARVTNGRSIEIAGVDSSIALDKWHTLAIRAEEGRFAVALDGQWLFTAYDETLRQPGRVALWRERDSAMRLDPVLIQPLPTMEGR